MSLSTCLAAGSCLVGTPGSAANTDLKQVLFGRLVNFHACMGSDMTVQFADTLEQTQSETAECSMLVIEKVQGIIGADPSSSDANPGQPPAIGTRDLAELRTLISIVFQWGVQPLLASVASSWPTTHVPTTSKIIDLTNAPNAYQALASFTTRIMALLFPLGLRQPLAETLITSTLLNRHLTDILRPCLALGWLPKSLASEAMPTLDDVRQLTMRLLAIMSPTETIAALGAVLSSPTLPASHVKRSCGSLLGQQLQRPDGVRGLCAVIFGEDPESDAVASLEKLEHFAKVITAVPAADDAQAYFRRIIPRIIALLSSDVPATYTRAAAFTISRMLTTDGSFRHHAATSAITSSNLHTPFLEFSNALKDAPTPNEGLRLLTTVLTNMDPSPLLISSIISPIVPALYSLSHRLEHVKTSDPAIKESVKNLLETWGRTAPQMNAMEVLWRIVQREGGEWKIDLEGNVMRVQESDNPGSLSLLTPQDLRRAEDSGELDLDANLLHLRPDPAHFIRFLKAIDRADAASELFVRLLQSYHQLKRDDDADPTRILLYLQLVMQMQQNLATQKSMLGKPQHILSFVKNVLESANMSGPTDSIAPLTRRMSAPSADETDLDGDADSDDDTPGEHIINADDEMRETALNLLLSILEVNEDLSPRTAPILNDIFLLLEPSTGNISESIQNLAREARMVMTARLASTDSARPRNTNTKGEEDLQETYQKALKLLQDPILPVRAHGLLLLRQLVSPRSATKPHIDRALVPAILSIFLQSIQDDDSYMFLNAVQGLAAMVQTFGKDVLKGLVRVYTEGLDHIAASNLEQRDVDTRLRVGEALGQVIRKYGDTLSIYVDILVPPLFNLVRSAHLPTALRTSALSLLAECVHTHSISLAHYTADLSEAMIDLLQVEGSRASATSRLEDDATPMMDANPTSTDARFPPFRRAALHFLGLLIRATTLRLFDSAQDGRSVLSTAFTRRAKTTLGYVAATDIDPVIKVMARETLEGLQQMEEAIAGL